MDLALSAHSSSVTVSPSLCTSVCTLRGSIAQYRTTCHMAPDLHVCAQPVLGVAYQTRFPKPCVAGSNPAGGTQQKGI